MAKAILTLLLAGTAGLAACNSRESGNEAEQINEADSASASAQPLGVVEGYPVGLAESLRLRDERLRAAASRASHGNRGLSSVIRANQFRWRPGQTVRVAFRGGDAAAYARIERAAQAWTQPGLGNVTLSFRDEAGRYRQWSPQDRDYAGDIRIGFLDDAQNGGFWSLVGLDSIDRSISDGIVGGGAGQQSMNFEGLAGSELPDNWEGTVIHEFGHALGFEHEHQHPAIVCGFRFDDDPGYVPTRDRLGQYINDRQGRRPGLYTSLSGPPNNWDRPKVDFNLASLRPSSAYELGNYDRMSVMEYFFEEEMFADGRRSPCFIERESNALSAGDRLAVARAYPTREQSAERVEQSQSDSMRALARAATSDAALSRSLDIRADYRASTNE